MTEIDHLVWSVPDLEAGVEQFEHMSGVRAAVGGSHPGMGTRNALLSLGPAAYLEIIGPDTTQTGFRQPRHFHIDDVDRPRLVTWAAKSNDVSETAAITLPRGWSLGNPAAGERKRPDGIMLAWQLTDPYIEVADGIVPFFIDWGDSPHPAADAPAGATLLSLRAEHPDPDSVRGAFEALGIGVPIDAGDTPALIATLETPNGTIELR